MQSPWKVFGHEEIKKLLRRQLTSGRLPHAYLFAGPEGVGKKMLALELASQILNTEKLTQHPDFALLQGEGEIGIEQVREFISHLAVKPFFGPKKVAIIDNAHLLNPASGNALLKTLEEPSGSTILILINSTATLLPTIVSRCQVFRFQAFSPRQMREFARERGLNGDEKLLNLSFGRPGRLFSLSRDKDFLQRERGQLESFEVMLSSPRAERLLAVSQFSELDSQELERMFQSWALWQAERLARDASGYKLLQTLCQAREDIAQNKNKKMILLGVALQM